MATRNDDTAKEPTTMTRRISWAVSLAGIVAALLQPACTVCTCRVPPATPGVTTAVAPTPAQAVQGGGLKGSAAYNWKNVVVLGGGFVSGIVFSPVEKGLVYARTDVGGAYRWDAAGKAWVPLTDQLGRDSNFFGIESLAADPVDANKVYLAAGTYTG